MKTIKNEYTHSRIITALVFVTIHPQLLMGADAFFTHLMPSRTMLPLGTTGLALGVRACYVGAQQMTTYRNPQSCLTACFGAGIGMWLNRCYRSEVSTLSASPRQRHQSTSTFSWLETIKQIGYPLLAYLAHPYYFKCYTQYPRLTTLATLAGTVGYLWQPWNKPRIIEGNSSAQKSDADNNGDHDLRACKIKNCITCQSRANRNNDLGGTDKRGVTVLSQTSYFPLIPAASNNSFSSKISSSSSSLSAKKDDTLGDGGDVRCGTVERDIFTADPWYQARCHPQTMKALKRAYLDKNQKAIDHYTHQVEQEALSWQKEFRESCKKNNGSSSASSVSSSSSSSTSPIITTQNLECGQGFVIKDGDKVTRKFELNPQYNNCSPKIIQNLKDAWESGNVTSIEQCDEELASEKSYIKNHGDNPDSLK